MVHVILGRATSLLGSRQGQPPGSAHRLWGWKDCNVGGDMSDQKGPSGSGTLSLPQGPPLRCGMATPVVPWGRQGLNCLSAPDVLKFSKVGG